VHDLRRSFVTCLSERGVFPHIVEAIINHISGAAKAGVAGVYNHAVHLEERRKALEEWSAHILQLVRARQVVKSEKPTNRARRQLSGTLAA
jgi:hypothetical protein